METNRHGLEEVGTNLLTGISGEDSNCLITCMSDCPTVNRPRTMNLGENRIFILPASFKNSYYTHHVTDYVFILTNLSQYQKETKHYADTLIRTPDLILALKMFAFSVFWTNILNPSLIVEDSISQFYEFITANL